MRSLPNKRRFDRFQPLTTVDDIDRDEIEPGQLGVARARVCD
jgi:hypothetical protein